MKDKIIVRNRKHLQYLVEEEIRTKGNKCDLNHIDISNITNLACLFHSSEFNENISQWNTSNVENMECMFIKSNFQGDISNWSPYNLESTVYMFESSKCVVPKWAKIYDKQQRNKYLLMRDLSSDLNLNQKHEKKIKI